MDIQLIGVSEAQSFGVTVGGIVAGGICGLPVLIIGCNKQRYVLAVIAFLVCIGCGLLLGILLAGPVGLLSAVGLSNLRSNRRRKY